LKRLDSRLRGNDEFHQTETLPKVSECELYYKYKTTSNIWCGVCGYNGTVREAKKAAQTANRLA
jgi:hypothetical protein